MSAPIDFQRFAFVIQKEVGRDPTISEWKASPTDDELARAICFGEYGDHEIIGIYECIPSERSSREITHEIAFLIPAIVEEANREGNRVRQIALDLIGDPEDEPEDDDEDSTFSALSQLGLDNERHKRAMVGGV